MASNSQEKDEIKQETLVEQKSAPWLKVSDSSKHRLNTNGVKKGEYPPCLCYFMIKSQKLTRSRHMFCHVWSLRRWINLLSKMKQMSYFHLKFLTLRVADPDLSMLTFNYTSQKYATFKKPAKTFHICILEIQSSCWRS